MTPAHFFCSWYVHLARVMLLSSMNATVALGSRNMRMRTFTALAIATLIGLAAAAAPAAAKTVKACQQEWRADKTAMQAAGKTEKAYVAECRTAAAATAAPAHKA